MTVTVSPVTPTFCQSVPLAMQNNRTRKPNIVDALGKDWFDVKEGEASIFRPENGSHELLARVQMDEWFRIAVAAK
jgi:hypothetical protein